jgi:hypothetical protein
LPEPALTRVQTFVPSIMVIYRQTENAPKRLRFHLTGHILHSTIVRSWFFLVIFKRLLFDRFLKLLADRERKLKDQGIAHKG